MIKKILIIVFSIGLLLSLASFGLMKRSLINRKENLQQATQKKVELKKSDIPGYDKISTDTVEINIKFVGTGTQGVFKTMQIKDKKKISDIITMLGKSVLITDETKINNMSGMASKNNSLVLVTKVGSKKEILFAYDDPAFGVGYLEINGKKYDPGLMFFRYINSFLEYSNANTNIGKQDVELFKKYNWTVDYEVNAVKETLPVNMKYDTGEFPIKLYWAYNNELSKSIGLDFSKYLGKCVVAYIYRLREPLPSFMKPRVDARGIVLKYEGKIIGAYIDAGRHNCFACSLDRKNLESVTQKKWENWVGQYINYSNGLEMKLSKMKPEEIIKLYYDAMNRHDEKTQFGCMSYRSLCDFLSINMDNNKLINKGFEDAFLDDYQNTISTKLLKVGVYNVVGNPVGTVEYAATVDLKFKKEITSTSGKQIRFIILKKETAKCGWRIIGTGTGP